MSAESGAPLPVVNIADVALIDLRHGDDFEAKLGRISPLIGSTGLGCMLTIVPPGKRAFPFHVHHATHEMFVILEGSGTYRFGKATYPVKKGDVVAAPAGGADKAHQLINTGSTDLKYLGISNNLGTQPEVVEYPDSNKFLAFAGAADGSPTAAPFRFIGRLTSAVDYWDGEGQGSKQEI